MPLRPPHLLCLLLRHPWPFPRLPCALLASMGRASPPCSTAPLGSLPAGSWELEFGAVPGVCALPPACRGTSPDSGQEFLQLAPNKPPGKEEWWEGAGNRLAVRTEWGLVGREPWSGDTQDRTGLQEEEEEEGEVASDHVPQPLSPVPPCTERTALESCWDSK